MNGDYYSMHEVLWWRHRSLIETVLVPNSKSGEELGIEVCACLLFQMRKPTNQLASQPDKSMKQVYDEYSNRWVVIGWLVG